MMVWYIIKYLIENYSVDINTNKDLFVYKSASIWSFGYVRYFVEKYNAKIHFEDGMMHYTISCS
jgi:hypothetical protein